MPTNVQRRHWTVTALSLCAVIVAVVCFMKPEVPTPADCRAVGLNVKAVHRQPVFRRSGWVPEFFPRPDVITEVELCEWTVPRPTELTESQLHVLENLSDIESLHLVECGLSDDQLRRILRRKPKLERLVVDGNTLTEAILPAIAALPTLRMLSIDCEEISLNAVESLSNGPKSRGFVSSTAISRLRRQFLLGPQPDRVQRYSYPPNERPHWPIGSQPKFASVSPTGSILGPFCDRLWAAESLNSDPASVAVHVGRVRHGVTGESLADNSFNDTSHASELTLAFVPPLTDPQGRRHWTSTSQQLVDRMSGSINLALNGFRPGMQLPSELTLQSLSIDYLDDHITQQIASPHCQEVFLHRYTGSEASLEELSLLGCQTFSLGSSSRFARYQPDHHQFGQKKIWWPDQPPISGRFLSQIENVKQLRSLYIEGHLPILPQPSISVDFARFANLSEVSLCDIAINDDSLGSLNQLANLRAVTLERLPLVTAHGLANFIRTSNIRHLTIGDGIQTGPDVFSAIAKSPWLSSFEIDILSISIPDDLVYLAEKPETLSFEITKGEFCDHEKPEIAEALYMYTKFFSLRDNYKRLYGDALAKNRERN